MPGMLEFCGYFLMIFAGILFGISRVTYREDVTDGVSREVLISNQKLIWSMLYGHPMTAGMWTFLALLALLHFLGKLP